MPRTSRRLGFVIGCVAPLLLAGSLELDWYRLVRSAGLGPPSVTAVDAFRTVAVVLAVLAAAAMACRLARRWRAATIAQALIGLAALALALRAIVAPPEIPPRAGIPQRGNFAMPVGIEIGAVLALAAATAIAAEALLALRRRRVSLTGALIATALAAGALMLTATDRVNVGTHGFGGDGETYGQLALDWRGVVFNHHHIETQPQSGGGVDQYYVQKILPSGVVWLEQRTLGIVATGPNVIYSFALLDAALIGLIALLWCLIADALALGPKGKVLGFIALLGNFLILKSASYYPVTTDIAGYAIGLAALYFFITRRTAALALTAVAGAFIYPTALYVAAALLLFPRADGPPAQQARSPRFAGAAAIAAAVVGAVLIRLATLDEHPLAALGETRLHGTSWLGVPLMAAYLFVAVSILLAGGRLDLAGRARALLRPRTVWVLALVVGVKLAQGTIAVHGVGLGRYQPYDTFPWRSTAAPGLFAIETVVYYGPVFILAAVAWPAVARRIAEHGTGILLVALLLVVSAIGTEPRVLLNIAPLIVPYVVMAVEPQRWSWTRIALYGALSLAMSKVWLYLGPIVPAQARAFPNQRYYMNGPYISHTMYFVLAGSLILATLVAYAIARGPVRPAELWRRSALAVALRARPLRPGAGRPC